VKDCSRCKPAGAFSQLRVDSNAAREGVSEELARAEEAQAERTITSTFKGATHRERLTTDGREELEPE